MNNLPNPEESATGGHTISVVAERTGLSRDVLRVWERRYKAVEPTRTAGGQRVYSDAELERFMLLAQATRHGRSIGSIAALSTDALLRLAADDEAARLRSMTGSEVPPAAVEQSTNNNVASHVAELALAHAVALDASSLDRELRRAIGQHGLPLFLESIVPMLMQRIGDEWAAQRLAIPHEHLASAVVLTILLESIRAIPETPSAPRLLVATPSGEHHVVGAALMAAAAALDGWRILFLGADVPADDLVLAARGTRAVALSLVHPEDPMRVVRDVRAMRAALPQDVPLVLGGASALRLLTELNAPGVTICRNLVDARAILAKIARGDDLQLNA